MNNNDNLLIHHEILKKLNNPKILYIPAASKDSSVNVESFKNYFKLNFNNEISILYLYNNIYTVNYLDDLIKQFDVIYFGGGTTKILYDCLIKNDFKKIIMKYLNEKIFVGLSAGGIVLSNSGYTDCDSYYDKFKYHNFKLTPGLGILDIIFVPHYQNLNNVVYQNTVLCLEEQTAVHVTDNTIRLIRSNKKYTGYIYTTDLKLLIDYKEEEISLWTK